MLMLVVIPVMALVRTTVDAEGTAALAENDTGESLVRHTEAEAAAAAADPWAKWTKTLQGKPFWTRWLEQLPGPDGWTMADDNTHFVGIQGKGYGAVPPGMHSAKLGLCQEFKITFSCPSSQAKDWTIEWKTHFRNEKKNSQNGTPYAKLLEGNGVHVLYEKQGHQERPSTNLNNHETLDIWGWAHKAWPSKTENVFKTCEEMTIEIDQTVWKEPEGKLDELSGGEFTTFKFGFGKATNVQTDDGSVSLIFGFQQICTQRSVQKEKKESDIPSAPNCFPGKPGALILHVNVAPGHADVPATTVKERVAAAAKQQAAIEVDRVVMYLQDDDA